MCDIPLHSMQPSHNYFGFFVVHLAVVASCLQEEAEKLLQSCQRYDLLNEFYQSHDDWEKV